MTTCYVIWAIWNRSDETKVTAALEGRGETLMMGVFFAGIASIDRAGGMYICAHTNSELRN